MSVRSTTATKKDPRGIILLVVLSMLTFFSVLVAAYLVFSNQSRQSSFVIASRVNHSADVNQLLNDALMKLVRGTADVNDPFFGEDLLSDYYGRRDGLDLRVKGLASAPTFHVAGGFIRVPMESFATGARPSTTHMWDDLYSGRVITFIEGPLANQSFRVLRSVYVSVSAMVDYDDLYIQLRPDLIGTPITEARVSAILYNNGTTANDGFRFRMNGVPRNSPGLGYDATGNAISRNATSQATPAAGLGFTLPIEFQPNHLGSATNKFPTGATSGDFDESFDAADFNNWYLSHRHEGGRIIPSFHRPAVVNYVLNERDWSDTMSTTYASDLQSLSVSIARSTFRPLPIAAGQFSGSSLAINPRFTGGNANYALRTPIRLSPAGGAARLDQIARALIGSPGNENPWDVDNDADGVPDSIWIDLGLPVITSPEGKLLRPLIAPMIEDLSGRLNANTTGNIDLANNSAGVSASALWASSRNRFMDPMNPTSPNPANVATRFQGVGYGPAEITIPSVDVSAGTAITDTSIRTGLVGVVTDRLQHGLRVASASPLPGLDDADSLDILRTGYRPMVHSAQAGFGYSQDPFGRSATGIGRNGQLVMARSGLAGTTTGTNETVNDPYEASPSGRLNGDNHFTVEELEAILRSNHFDLELLPQRLRNRLGRLTELHPEFAHALTTLSISSDIPSFAEHETSLLLALADEFGPTFSALNNAQMSQLIAPEIRLGRKLDVNRAIGNGVDDNGNGTIDEPSETETETFAVSAGSGQTVPTAYQGIVPDYTHGAGAVTGRELLARHLYVLMAGLTSNAAAFPSVSVGSGMQTPAFKARRLAQWAVNVVDYRDPDSIMTRFSYDPNPWDGWALSGTDVVWGVETPELVLSEAFALHDVRVKDSEFDDGGQKDKLDTTTPDNDTDQIRIPQGSLFIELYAPRSPIDTVGNDQSTKQAAPQELYTVAANGFAQLDLARQAPAPSGGVGAPVWRIALSQPHYAQSPGVYPASGQQTLDPQTVRTTLVDSASFEPSQPDELDPAAPALPISRYIWFTDFADQAAVNSIISSNSIGDMASNQVFFAPDSVNGAGRLLEAGQYLAIAPRVTTNIGSHTPGGTMPDRPSRHRFVSTAGEGVVHFDVNDARRTPALNAASSYTDALPLVVGTFPPVGWAASVFANNLVGLNVSEPLPRSAGYYPQPTERYLGTSGAGSADYPLNDAYVDIVVGGNTAPDVPLDLGTGRIPGSLVPTAPSMVGEEPALGTIPSYCSAFLQRLADPLSVYHPVNNPYRTVDWMTIDLTVFSGEERSSRVVATSDYTRRTRQRNGFIGTTNANSLFSYQTDFVAPSVPMNTLAPDFFSLTGDASLQSSFSFLNTSEATSNPAFNGFSASIGSLGGAAMNVIGKDRNLPQTPFAQHPWLNRPFASHLELMIVPACSQGRLFEEFTIANGATDPVVYPESLSAMPTAAEIQAYYGPYRHLLNFFNSRPTDAEAGQFDRILDFITTLPRFRGEVEMISPAASRLPVVPINALFRPPFNIQWDNHRIGRVNLNTLAEFPVWAGVMQGHLNPQEFVLANGNGGSQSQLSFNQFVQSRRGYTPVAGVPRPVTATPPYNYVPGALDSRFPSEFMGIFRKDLESPYFPILRDMPSNNLLARRGINSGLLRASGDLSTAAPPTGAATTPPFFVRAISQEPLATTSVDQDRNRNPFLRFQSLMRMPNLVTDNSQVFLVRLTMGLFEVDANTLSLGREYNEDIGQQDRYEAIFIIDRSRPVGFIPGNDLNARDVVIFEKFYQ